MGLRLVWQPWVQAEVLIVTADSASKRTQKPKSVKSRLIDENSLNGEKLIKKTKSDVFIT